MAGRTAGNRRPRTGGIRARMAAAAIAVAALAVTIVAAGVLVVGSGSFVDLMTADGHPADAARAMFDQSVGRVVLAALIVAVAAGTLLSAALAARLARPLRDLRGAARRIAAGDLEARVGLRGPDEVVDLASSFNQMAERLEEQERLRREFIANAAHELRTPLTNLQGYLEALRDEVIPAERETFESLWDEAERLVRLSRSLDLLAEGDAVRGLPRRLEPLDLVAAARASAELVAPGMTAAGLAFDVDLPPALVGLADPDGVAQILGNLLQNTLRYTPRGGYVRLCGGPADGGVELAVVNSGPGIPAADLPHVFERFYRVEKSRDAARGGAGIGLAIVRDLVEAYGGSVRAESGGGETRFSVVLRPG